MCGSVVKRWLSVHGWCGWPSSIVSICGADTRSQASALASSIHKTLPHLLSQEINTPRHTIPALSDLCVPCALTSATSTEIPALKSLSILPQGSQGSLAAHKLRFGEQLQRQATCAPPPLMYPAFCPNPCYSNSHSWGGHGPTPREAEAE